MNKLSIGGAAVAFAAAIAPVTAQPAPPPPGVAQGTAPLAVARPTPNVHARMMVVPHQSMTRDSAVKHVAAMFARLDTNHDGFITREEAAAVHERMAAMQGGMGEQMAGRHLPMPNRAAMFDRLDTNHDGSLSRQEFLSAQPEIREQRVVVLRRGGQEAGAMPEMPDMQGMKMRMHAMGMGGMQHGQGHGFGAHMFEMADTNHDGRVSLAEAQALALAHFDRLDTNHDGQITPDEHARAHQMMHGR